MQLSEQQINLVEQRTSLLAVTPENNAFDTLKEEFGEHTYFLNEEGLFAFVREGEKAETAHLQAFAVWDKSDNSKLLQLAKPQRAGLMLDLEKPSLHDAAGEPDTIH